MYLYNEVINLAMQPLGVVLHAHLVPFLDLPEHILHLPRPPHLIGCQHHHTLIVIHPVHPVNHNHVTCMCYIHSMYMYITCTCTLDLNPASWAASVAQLAEHWTSNPVVTGSNPVRGSSLFFFTVCLWTMPYLVLPSFAYTCTRFDHVHTCTCT